MQRKPGTCSPCTLDSWKEFEVEEKTKKIPNIRIYFLKKVLHPEL
jgi:hypothetical protein